MLLSWLGKVAGAKPHAVLLWLLAPLILAAQVADAAPFIQEAAIRDAQMTVRARQALYQDTLLSSLNLGVSIHNHVATLWGHVPSAFLSERAAAKVKNVSGVARVVNRLSVETPGDPLLQFLKSTPRPESPPISEKRSMPTVISGREGEFAPLPSNAPSPGIQLMPAIPLGASDAKPQAAAAKPQAVTKPQALAVNPQAEIIRRLQQDNPRLSRVRVEVTGGVVRLHGTVSAWTDLYEFAKQLSHVAGVERVILENVRLEPASGR